MSRTTGGSPRRSQGDEPFELQLAGQRAPLRVLRFEGREAMNALYAFEVAVETDADDALLGSALESAASLSVRHDGRILRSVHGVVDGCETVGHTTGGTSVVALRVVPRMAHLVHRRTCRIYQDQTTRQIAERVLGKVDNTWKLSRTLGARRYCVQYDETDYEFVSRLCAAEGIFYWFEHAADDSGAGRERVVFSDDATLYATIDGAEDLVYRPQLDGGSALGGAENHVTSFRLRNEVALERVLFRDRDFERPANPFVDTAGAWTSAAPSPTEMRAFIDEVRAVYEHNLSREQAPLQPLPARFALEAANAATRVAEGATACRRVLPGHRFALAEHDLSIADGRYVAVACHHEGRAAHTTDDASTYLNRFTAVPAAVPFRPARPRRVLRQTLETAVVVGPPGEEIHTDTHGRVRVQFPWDLDGNHTDASSCWLRVAQAWAGAGFGAQFLPRVGTEVLVGYVDGDADRPIVVGTVHNGTTLTPFSFPEDFETSGIRTRSTPDGAGGHELVFRDRAGAESAALRSSGALDLSAARNAAVTAAGAMFIASGGDRTEEIGNDLVTTITGSERHSTGASRVTRVAGSDALEVTGEHQSAFHGSRVVQTDGAVLERIGSSRVTTIGRSDARADEILNVSGQLRVAAGEEARIASSISLRLLCGNSSILLEPNRIVIDSPEIQLQAKKRIALVQGDPPAATLTLAGSAALGGGTTSVVGGGKGGGKLFLDGDAHLDGGLVKLNCGPAGGAGGKKIGIAEEKASVTFTVTGEGLDPEVRSVVLVIGTPDGGSVERDCAVGGSVTLEGRPGDVFTLLETRAGVDKIAFFKKADGTADSNRG